MTETELNSTQAKPAPTMAPGPASTGQRMILLLVAAVIILVDHISKLFIEQWLPLNHSWAPLPEWGHLFRITHVSNTGAAFGLFPGGSLIFTFIAVVVAAIILIYNYRLPSGHRLLRVALGLQLGGALGNLIDRLRLGHVTDFFDFGPWPVFNVADASIVAGVVILGLMMITEQEPERESREPESADEEEAGQTAMSSHFQSPKQNEQAT